MAIQSSNVHEVIKQLQDNNRRITRLLESIPTSDDRVLAELDQLMNRQRQLMNTSTTKEQGTYFFEQASGMAMTLRERYLTLLNKGLLRKKL